MGVPESILREQMIASAEYGDRTRLKRDRRNQFEVMRASERDPQTGLYGLVSQLGDRVLARKLHNTDNRSGDSVPWYRSSNSGAVAYDGNNWRDDPFLPQDEEELTGSPLAFLYIQYIESTSLGQKFGLWFKSPELDTATLLDTITYGVETGSLTGTYESVVVVDKGIYAIQSEQLPKQTNGSGRLMRTWLVRNGIVEASSTGFSYGGILGTYRAYLRQSFTVYSETGTTRLVGDQDDVEAFEVFKKNRNDDITAPIAGDSRANEFLTIYGDKGYVAVKPPTKPLNQLARTELELFNNVSLVGASSDPRELQILEIADIDQYLLLIGKGSGPLDVQFNSFKNNPANKLLETKYTFSLSAAKIAEEIPGLIQAQTPTVIRIPRVIPPNLIDT